MNSKLQPKFTKSQFQSAFQNQKFITEKLSEIVTLVDQNSEGLYFKITNGNIQLKNEFFLFISEYNKKNIYFINKELYENNIRLTIDVINHGYLHLSVRVRLFVDGKTVSQKTENCYRGLSIDAKTLAEYQNILQLEEKLHSFVLKLVDNCILESKNDMFDSSCKDIDNYHKKMIQKNIDEKLEKENKSELPIICKVKAVNVYTNLKKDLYSIELSLNNNSLEYRVNTALLEKYEYTIRKEEVKQYLNEKEAGITVMIKAISLSDIISLVPALFVKDNKSYPFTEQLHNLLQNSATFISGVKYIYITGNDTEERKELKLTFRNGYNCKVTIYNSIDVSCPEIFSFQINKKSLYGNLYAEDYEIESIDDRTILEEFKSLVEKLNYIIRNDM